VPSRARVGARRARRRGGAAPTVRCRHVFALRPRGMVVARPDRMTFKKLFLLGSVVAGAAYLQNKSRRERLFGQARDLLDRAKHRASDVTQRMEQRAESMGVTSRDNGLGSSMGTEAPGYGGISGSDIGG